MRELLRSQRMSQKLTDKCPSLSATGDSWGAKSEQGWNVRRGVSVVLLVSGSVGLGPPGTVLVGRDGTHVAPTWKREVQASVRRSSHPSSSLSWNKPAGGRHRGLVGFELPARSCQLDISTRRAGWFIRWIREESVSEFIQMSRYGRGSAESSTSWRLWSTRDPPVSVPDGECSGRPRDSWTGTNQLSFVAGHPAGSPAYTLHSFR